MEQRIGRYPVRTNIQELESLKTVSIKRLSPKLFRDLAENSSSYEAVKWGIVLGSLDGTSDFVDPLLFLARHSEFTVYAVNVLLRSYSQNPRLKEGFLVLLSVTRQWGVIRLIEALLGVPQYVQDLAVQRGCLLAGMENNEGIPMEIAFTLASRIDLYHFLDVARTDRRVFVAFAEMMNTLLTDSTPLGGLQDLAAPEKLFAAYVALLERHEPDIFVLEGLRAARIF